MAGPPGPSPLRYMPYFLSPVDSRRIVPTHAARRSQQLVHPIYEIPLVVFEGNSLDINNHRSAARSTSSKKQQSHLSGT